MANADTANPPNANAKGVVMMLALRRFPYLES